MGIDTPSDDFTISIQLNMFHQCQLGTNFNLDFPFPKEKNQIKMDWFYLIASKYKQTFEPRG